jgi:hypothetical protein
MVFQHVPREPQHPPPVGHKRILPPPVGLKQVFVLLVQPAVDLDRHLEPKKPDVDVVEPATEKHGNVRLPAADARPPQYPVAEPFGGRPGQVARVQQQPGPLGVPDAIPRPRQSVIHPRQSGRSGTQSSVYGVTAGEGSQINCSQSRCGVAQAASGHDQLGRDPPAAKAEAGLRRGRIRHRHLDGGERRLRPE